MTLHIFTKSGMINRAEWSCALFKMLSYEQFLLIFFCSTFPYITLIVILVSGIQKEVPQCCLAATLALQVLIEHARIWGTSETNNVHFNELSFQLLDTVKRLAGHVIGIVEVRAFLVKNVPCVSCLLLLLVTAKFV